MTDTFMIQKVVDGKPTGKVVSFNFETELVKDNLNYYGVMLQQAIRRLNMTDEEFLAQIEPQYSTENG